MINGMISAADFVQAQHLHRKSGARRVNMAAAALAACGAAATVAGVGDFGWIALCGGVGGLIGEFVNAHLLMPRKVRKLHAQQKSFAEQITYAWDTEFISCQTRSGSARRPWSHYLKVKEDEHVFLLYHADNLFEMFPKPWFPNAETLEDFRKLACRSGGGAS